MSEIIVSPSILSANFANLERDIKLVEDNGADWLHVDVMDGHFVPNITIGVPVVQSIKRIAKLPLDVHLMIENPKKYIEAFAKAGADILTFHYEALKRDNFANNQAVNVSSKDEIFELIDYIKSYGIKAGMSIKPKTSADEIIPYLTFLDLVLVMTVEPGFGGQSFMLECAKKIPVIKNNAHKELIIQVDGGINAETAKICTEYGATSLVAGNYIYKSDNVKSAIASLR